jgi:hypothetical protein
MEVFSAGFSACGYWPNPLNERQWYPQKRGLRLRALQGTLKIKQVCKPACTGFTAHLFLQVF